MIKSFLRRVKLHEEKSLSGGPEARALLKEIRAQSKRVAEAIKGLPEGHTDFTSGLTITFVPPDTNITPGRYEGEETPIKDKSAVVHLDATDLDRPEVFITFSGDKEEYPETLKDYYTVPGPSSVKQKKLPVLRALFREGWKPLWNSLLGDDSEKYTFWIHPKIPHPYLKGKRKEQLEESKSKAKKLLNKLQYGLDNIEKTEYREIILVLVPANPEKYTFQGEVLKAEVGGNGVTILAPSVHGTIYWVDEDDVEDDPDEIEKSLDPAIFDFIESVFNFKTDEKRVFYLLSLGWEPFWRIGKFGSWSKNLKKFPFKIETRNHEQLEESKPKSKAEILIGQLAHGNEVKVAQGYHLLDLHFTPRNPKEFTFQNSVFEASIESEEEGLWVGIPTVDGTVNWSDEDDLLDKYLIADLDPEAVELAHSIFSRKTLEERIGYLLDSGFQPVWYVGKPKKPMEQSEEYPFKMSARKQNTLEEASEARLKKAKELLNQIHEYFHFDGEYGPLELEFWPKKSKEKFFTSEHGERVSGFIEDDGKDGELILEVFGPKGVQFIGHEGHSFQETLNKIDPRLRKFVLSVFSENSVEEHVANLLEWGFESWWVGESKRYKVNPYAQSQPQRKHQELEEELSREREEAIRIIREYRKETKAARTHEHFNRVDLFMVPCGSTGISSQRENIFWRQEIVNETVAYITPKGEVEFQRATHYPRVYHAYHEKTKNREIQNLEDALTFLMENNWRPVWKYTRRNQSFSEYEPRPKDLSVFKSRKDDELEEGQKKFLTAEKYVELLSQGREISKEKGEELRLHIDKGGLVSVINSRVASDFSQEILKSDISSLLSKAERVWWTIVDNRGKDTKHPSYPYKTRTRRDKRIEEGPRRVFRRGGVFERRTVLSARLNQASGS